MDVGLMLSALRGERAAVRGALACNELTRSRSLALTEEDAREVVAARDDALQREGLVEVGTGVLPLLVETFADSPYLSADEYADALCDLQRVFYALRRQTGVTIADADLLVAMRRAFDGDEVAGCVELLAAKDLDELLDGHAGAARPAYTPEDPACEEADADCPIDAIGWSDLVRPWNEDTWLDSFEADGWDGERWSDAHGCAYDE